MKERIGTATIGSESKTLGNSKGHFLAQALVTHSEGLKTKAVHPLFACPPTHSSPLPYLPLFQRIEDDGWQSEAQCGTVEKHV
jgi:hypothetical protein